MIDYISGRLAELNPTFAVIDCAGVGYEINITLIDYSALEGKDEAKLYVHESIREDAHVLYGFIERGGRQMFRMLMGFSGAWPLLFCCFLCGRCWGLSCRHLYGRSLYRCCWCCIDGRCHAFCAELCLLN